MTDNSVMAAKDFTAGYHDIGFAKIDHHRSSRRGFPEVVFGKGKTTEQIVKISRKIIAHDGILLVTHVDEKAFRKLKKYYPGIKFDKNARIIMPVTSTAVGRRGTNPVSKYSITTGIPITNAASAKKPKMEVKKISGRSRRIRPAIVSRMRIPSR